MITTPRVAIGCSGLGHVQRGIESWAADLVSALRADGIDVTLFGGAPGDGITPIRSCLRRDGYSNRALVRLFRHLGGWRYALGSPYDVEQTTFSLGLLRAVRRDFDIIHLQDPAIASWLQRAHEHGLSRPQVLYANGTGEGAAVMRRFPHLQLLTRQAYEEWLPQAPSGQQVFMVPNFIDTNRFHPGDHAQARARFDLPAGALIVLCCSAIRRTHKRIDYLLMEFAQALRESGRDAVLVLAGAREADTDGIVREGRALLGDRVRFLLDVPRADMPVLYRAANLFVLASLHEMFGIVLLEAMASGLAVLCHDTPNFRAVAGPAAAYRDIEVRGGLAQGFATMFDAAERNAMAAGARPWVEQHFSTTAIVPRIRSVYEAILTGLIND